MFHFDFFVHDKHLVKVMHALNGIAMNLQVVPVANAETAANGAGKPEKVRAKVIGDLPEQLVAWAREHGHDEIRRTDAAHFLDSLGRVPSGAGSLLDRAMKKGLIKRQGRAKGPGHHATYTVEGN